MKNSIRLALIILAYGIVAAIIVYFTAKSGTYPDGADTMFYVYRSDALYHSIKDNGIWYPLWNPYWYNGVQISRYWAPLCTYVMAGCQALCGGNPYNGYLVFVGLIYFVGALTWLLIGYKHDRIAVGALIGFLWGILPNNLFQIYDEGVLVRCMILTFLPAYIAAMYDYLSLKKYTGLPKMYIYMILMVMTHMGYAGMVALSTCCYLLMDMIVNKIKFKNVMYCVFAVVAAMATCGIWLLPSLVGGITSTDSSQIMASYFQSLNKTLNPFYGILSGYDRWADHQQFAYFGIVMFIFCILGVIFSRKRQKSTFITALLTVVLTSPVFYPFLAKMPGGSMLWMLRFISIALCFALIGLFFWNSIRKSIYITICALLLIEAIPGMRMITVHNNGVTAEERYEDILDKTLIGEAREITVQRLQSEEGLGIIDYDQAYLIAGYEYGEKNIQYSLGQGIQSAITYRNIVQQNQALDDKHFVYFFDRCLELGDDTVLLNAKRYDNDEEVIKDMDDAAEKSGYELVDTRNSERLYHLKDVTGNFGVVTDYKAIGIGQGNTNVSLGFPSVEETLDPNLNHYTFEDLRKYDTIVLTDFTYDDKQEAEELVRKLSDDGVKVIIFADKLPVDRMSGMQSFLDISCQSIVFNNGYPELSIGDYVFNPDLFPQGYTNWKTVYINGLDNEIGTFVDSGKTVAFLGTKYNDNIMVVGINLFFHYQLTKDETVGMILSEYFGLNNDEVPERRIVPLEVKATEEGITITSPEDDVDSTFAYHDIFESERELKKKNNLLYVDSGTTKITFKYPLLLKSILASILGLIMAVIVFTISRKDFLKEKYKLHVSEEE